MKRLILSSMAAFLIVLLLLSSVAYAGGSSDKAQLADFKTGKQLGIQEESQMGSPSKGAKYPAATGIIGEPVTGESYAVIIGISDYPGDDDVLQGGLDLFYADDDAISMKEVLETYYGFVDENICLLGGPNDVADWGNGNVATREVILDAIDDLADEVEEDDEVVFFFSGHGTIQSGNNSKGKESNSRNNVGIVTWDDEEENVAVIWDYDLQDAFSGFETDRIIYIFDCCKAGGMTELEGNGITCMATTENGLSAEYGEDYALYYPEMPGLDPAKINHGLFTYFFVVLGMQYGMADLNSPDGPDGYVTIEEAFDFARSALESLSRSSNGLLRQIPTIEDNFANDLLL